ncbi:outer membrane beta-barrel protein [Archangium sp.]|uniref:outer membrane beta-barrel protein n=1 Tax=Archangium sp. TaxID=1872627 RepID=UPI002D4FA1F4|nr:outer membrane beta-barrel protein [Archangium sp.]HYO53529.1 outer membrane beta-barrel protein [Archangium sp.]
MKVHSWMGGIAVVALCTTGSAFAAIDAADVGDRLHFDPDRTMVGLDVRVGVGGLTGDLGARTAPGPLLGITAGAQPWRNLGIEAGVEGQRLPIDDDRVGDEQAMYRYNLGVLAKAGPLVLEDKLRPYVGVGIGVSYLNATDGADTLYENDFITEVPLAAGLDYRFTNNIYAGARASYRLLMGDEFADAATVTLDPDEGNPDGNLLNFGLMVGGRF